MKMQIAIVSYTATMNASHPLTSKEFRDTYSRVPRLCVDLVIKAPSGIVLTLRKIPSWQGQWHFPGGTVLYKELIEQAIHRISDEEVGVDVTATSMLGYIEYTDEQAERGFGWTVSLVFLCKTESTEFRRENYDASDIRAFTELPENLIAEQRKFLESHPKWR